MDQPAAAAGSRAAAAARRVQWPTTAMLRVLAIAAVPVVVLLLLSAGYGFHRDELYFIVAGRHPALGYPDQPPFTPLVSVLAVDLLGLSPTAVRILPALSMGALVVLTGLIVRDLGGSGRAMAIGAAVMAVSGFLAMGHLDVTATYDAVAWAAVLWLVVRLLAGASPRLWLAVGLLAGLALWNKHMILFLAAGLFVGLLVARRWDVLRSRWPYLAALIAVVVWAPNLAWQAANGFPQLTMAASISTRDYGLDALVFELSLLAGELLVVVTIAGLAWLLGSAAGRPWRAIGWAFLVVLALVIVLHGRSYYATGFFPVLMAAGAIPADRWLRGGRPRLRAALLAVVTIASAVVIGVTVLPILPLPVLAASPIPGFYRESAEQVGWPELATKVSSIIGQLDPAERERAIVLASNYGPASAVELLGSGEVPVYSGHNAWWSWGPPPNERDITILVGWWPYEAIAPLGSCRPVGKVDNGHGIENQEQGSGILLCRDRVIPWSTIWDLYRHID